MRRFVQLLLRWEWLILILALPLLMYPSGPRSLVLLLIPFLWLLRWLFTGRILPLTPLNTAVLLLSLALLVSLYAVFDIALSMPKIAGLVTGIALMYAAVSYTREVPAGKWTLLAAITLAGAGMAIIGLFGTRWTGPAQPLNALGARLPGQLSQIPGAVGGFINPNELAGVLGWIAPLLIACVVGLFRPLWRNHKLLLLVLAGSAALTAVVLLATLSRGGVFGFGLALLVMLAIRYRWARWLLLATLVGGVVLAVIYDLPTVVLGGGAADEFGLQGRLEIWSRAIYGMQDFPFTGMSMNGFRRVVHILYPLFLISPDVDLGHAHNHLLQAGVDLGIPGLIAYLAIWLGSVVMLWRGWVDGRDQGDRVLVIGLAGSLTAGWFFGMLDAIALGARPGFVWWLLLAMVIAVFNSTRQPVAAATTSVATVQEPATTPA